MAIKAPLLKSVESLSEAVIVMDLRDPYFDPNWHFHPHYQLFTVIEGTGTRLIGDSIQPFTPGDTVFLAPNIPHLWRCDPMYFQADSTLMTRGIVIYFQEDFLGKELFDRSEMHAIRHFLRESKHGYSLSDPFRQRIVDKLLKFPTMTGFEKVIQLLILLNEIAHTPFKQPITSLGYRNTYKKSETERMQRVHNYLLQHFREEIRLSDVAAHAGMSEAAFCRYFKARTNKTLTTLVNEIRIGEACRLLLNENYTIAQIAYETGFDTLSNFNRNFKKITGKTPGKYREDYQLSTR
ncbi:MAG: AraC family transcriptional regulator [Spirosomataceae bacterium]